MSKKPTAQDPKKDLKKVQKKEAVSAEMNAEKIAEIAAEIASSPIDAPHKAVFLITIADGTFNQALYKRYQELLKQYRESLIAEVDAIEQQIQELEAQYDEAKDQMEDAALGALQQIDAAAQHIEEKTLQELERRGTTHAQQQVESIRENLRNNDQ